MYYRSFSYFFPYFINSVLRFLDFLLFYKRQVCVSYICSMEKIQQEKRGWILAALMITMTLAAMDITIISTVVPQIVSDLGGFSKFSWVFSIYLLTQTITIPLYGKISDIYGRKRILLFGIVVFLIGSAVSGAAWDMSSLIAFRGIQGIGAGSIMATVNTIAGDIYSVEERAKIQGYLSSIWGVSAIIGPALGGALAEYVSWRWIFFINIPIGALAIVFLLVFFKEKVEVVKTKIDYKGAILIMLSLSLTLIFLLEGGQNWPWFSWQSLVIVLLLIGLGVWTYQTEKKTPDAIMPLWIWKNRTIGFTSFAMIAMGISMMGPETFLPTFTQSVLGLGTIASGFVLASMSIGWPTASALSGRLYLRIGFRETSLIGASLVILSTIGFLLIPKPQPIYLIVINQVTLGAGFGLLSTPSLVGTQSMVSWHQRGVVTSSIVFSRNLGQSLGATIFGAIFNNTLNYQMENAPAELASSTQNILATLEDQSVSETAKSFLRTSISNSMDYIYWGILFFALLIFLWIYLVPHRDPKDISTIEVEKN